MWRRSAGSQIRIAETGSALEPAAKLTEAFCCAVIGMVDMDLLKLGSELGSTAVVTGA